MTESTCSTFCAGNLKIYEPFACEILAIFFAPMCFDLMKALYTQTYPMSMSFYLKSRFQSRV